MQEQGLTGGHVAVGRLLREAYLHATDKAAVSPQPLFQPVSSSALSLQWLVPRLARFCKRLTLTEPWSCPDSRLGAWFFTSSGRLRYLPFTEESHQPVEAAGTSARAACRPWPTGGSVTVAQPHPAPSPCLELAPSTCEGADRVFSQHLQGHGFHENEGLGCGPQALEGTGHI